MISSLNNNNKSVSNDNNDINEFKNKNNINEERYDCL